MVWLVTPREAVRLQALSPEELAGEIQDQSHDRFGHIELDGPVGAFPMGALKTDRVTGLRLALIGESAHLFPPIGAQGLNLTLRDVANLVDCLEGLDLDEPDPISRALRRYERDRARDIGFRVNSIDVLNRSLLVHALPVDFARAFALNFFSAFGPLRRALMREGVTPHGPTPKLMRERPPVFSRARASLTCESPPGTSIRFGCGSTWCSPICATSRPTSCACRRSSARTRPFRAWRSRRPATMSPCTGRRAYNGVALLSKAPMECVPGLPGDESDEQSRYIEAVIPFGPRVARVGCLYLPNGNPLGTEKYAYKLAWMDRLIAHARDMLKHEEVFVLAGDYNVIPDARDVYDPAAWVGDALYALPTRQKFRELLALGFTDALRATTDEAKQYTFWDYQAGCWPKNLGLRIDHLLLSPQAADRLEGVKIDRDMRAKDKPSDHVPVRVDLRD